MTDRVRAAYQRIAEVDRPEIWIDLRPEAEVAAEVAAAGSLPLAGKLLAVKGNIDVAGLPTTAGCPAYAYRPATDAPAVARLREAGAVVIGTTNLDQFATGLVGTRSPYGAVRNAVDPSRISGGSSSGSAVAVALGIADLALGTDTAGSGRVPAALNGIVGLKPTRGLVSTDGVVPACRSLDCVSVFASTVDEAAAALGFLADLSGFTPQSRYRIGVPKELLSIDIDADIVDFDIATFLEAGAMLYGSAFVAERYAAVGRFIEEHPSDVDPTVAGIILAAKNLPAYQLFEDLEKLAALKTITDAQLSTVDAIVVPTTTGHPTIAEVAADPVRTNTELGRFTTFANPLDLAAIAVPAGTVDGLPFGISFLGPAGSDQLLIDIARRLI